MYIEIAYDNVWTEHIWDIQVKLINALKPMCSIYIRFVNFKCDKHNNLEDKLKRLSVFRRRFVHGKESVFILYLTTGNNRHKGIAFNNSFGTKYGCAVIEYSYHKSIEGNIHNILHEVGHIFNMSHQPIGYMSCGTPMLDDWTRLNKRQGKNCVFRLYPNIFI
jgi:hypothetical protein